MGRFILLTLRPYAILVVAAVTLSGCISEEKASDDTICYEDCQLKKVEAVQGCEDLSSSDLQYLFRVEQKSLDPMILSDQLEAVKEVGRMGCRSSATLLEIVAANTNFHIMVREAASNALQDWQDPQVLLALGRNNTVDLPRIEYSGPACSTNYLLTNGQRVNSVVDWEQLIEDIGALAPTDPLLVDYLAEPMTCDGWDGFALQRAAANRIESGNPTSDLGLVTAALALVPRGSSGGINFMNRVTNFAYMDYQNTQLDAVLMGPLSHADDSVRQMAVDLLWNRCINRGFCTPAIKSALKDRMEHDRILRVRYGAAFALWRIKQKESGLP